MTKTFSQMYTKDSPEEILRLERQGHRIDDNGNIITPDKKAQHTPGPWQTGKGNPSEMLIYTAGGRRLIASCHTPEMMAHGDEKANAHLIAAAPELLTALHLARGYVAGCSDDEIANGDLKFIDAAIAKARGQS